METQQVKLQITKLCVQCQMTYMVLSFQLFWLQHNVSFLDWWNSPWQVFYSCSSEVSSTTQASPSHLHTMATLGFLAEKLFLTEKDSTNLLLCILHDSKVRTT